MMITTFFVVIVAALHVYFMVLEMFFWTKPAGLKAFRMSRQKAEDSKVLAANQGLYNGFLAAGLTWSIFVDPEFAFSLRAFFLICVFLAGLYGAATVSRKIFFVQALPAFLGFVCAFFNL